MSANESEKIKQDLRYGELVQANWKGTQTYRNIATGEILEMELVEKEVSRLLKGGWRRVYIGDFMELLGELYAHGQKIRVIDYILSNLDSENKFTQTQQMVSKNANIAFPTVNQTFKFLLKKDFFKKVGTAYVVNTNFVCAFGSDKKNAMLAIRYKYKEPTLPQFDEKVTA